MPNQYAHHAEESTLLSTLLCGRALGAPLRLLPMSHHPDRGPTRTHPDSSCHTRTHSRTHPDTPRHSQTEGPPGQ
eukprot:1177831-Prorocentrum_minimum.AAC.1